MILDQLIEKKELLAYCDLRMRRLTKAKHEEMLRQPPEKRDLVAKRIDARVGGTGPSEETGAWCKIKEERKPIGERLTPTYRKATGREEGDEGGTFMTPNCEKYTIDVTVCKDDLVRCLNAIIAIHGKDIVARCMVDSDEMCFEAETSLIHNCPKDCTMEDCDRCNEGMRDIKTNHRIKTTHCNVSKGYNAMLIPCGILLVAVQSMVMGDMVDITCKDHDLVHQMNPDGVSQTGQKKYGSAKVEN
jgi:hypothetical protein